MLKLIPCTACANVSTRDRVHCHECKGVGKIEIRTEECKRSPKTCPISFDPMVGGWECSKCGDSGPC